MQKLPLLICIFPEISITPRGGHHNLAEPEHRSLCTLQNGDTHYFSINKLQQGSVSSRSQNSDQTEGICA